MRSLDSLRTLRHRGYTLTVARIAALPYRRAYAKLTLVQRRRATQFSSAKLRRSYLACKGLQQQLRQRKPKYYFSMSHTSKWVVIASAARRIGVDAERSGEKILLDLVKLIAANRYEANWAAADRPESSMRGLLLWLAKEAQFKSAGNFQAHFDPQTIPVYGAAGWHRNLVFARVLGLQIAVWR